MSSKLTKIQICEVVTGYKHHAYIYNEITISFSSFLFLNTLPRLEDFLAHINTCIQHTCTQMMFLLFLLPPLLPCTHAHLCAHMLLFIFTNTALVQVLLILQSDHCNSSPTALPVPSMLALVYPPNCFWSYLS